LLLCGFLSKLGLGFQMQGTILLLL